MQTIRHEMMFGIGERQLDSIRALAKQVHHGRAEQREARGIDQIGERLWRLVQQDHNLRFLARDTAQACFQSRQCKEVKTAWTRKVLVQKIVPMKTGPA